MNSLYLRGNVKMNILRFSVISFFLFSIYNVEAAEFGPKTEAEEQVTVKATKIKPSEHKFARFDYAGPPLLLAIPVLDPGIPEDPADYEKKEVWPELRKAESVRSALKLRSTLLKTNLFSDVIVVPDTSVSADLFLMGSIGKSNGEEFQLTVELYDTTGERWMKKQTFKVRTNEEWMTNPSLIDVDPFRDVYVDAAEAVAKVIVIEGKKHTKLAKKNRKYIEKGRENKVRMSDIDKVIMIRQLLFARSLAPDIYGETVITKKGKWKLAYMPLTDDTEWERVQAVKAADNRFQEHSMANYDSLTVQIDDPYSIWQRDAFPIARDARLARNAANAQLALGIFAALAGAAAAADGSQTAGAVVAAAGLASVATSFKTRAEFKQQASLLDELGNSVQGVIAPKIIEMQGRQVDLVGTAQEQVAQWRALLKEIYEDTSVDPGAIDIVVVGQN
jgi:hypothetical protein